MTQHRHLKPSAPTISDRFGRIVSTMSHTQLSLIASHLAGGSAFCCRKNARARVVVCATLRDRLVLADYAYEAWGCEFSHERWARDLYLERFFCFV